VHTDLLAAGKIGDPFFRLNEKDQQWIENERGSTGTTLARRRRDAGARSRRAGVRGLDTFAEVFVNGARADRRQHVPQLARDVKAKLKAGDNQILVRFASPIATVKPAYDKLGYKLPGRQRPGQGDGQHVGAQGALPLRLGLGPALRHQRHLAPVALEAWDEARLDDVAGVPEQARSGKTAELGFVRARGRGARGQGARHGRAAGRPDAGPRRRDAEGRAPTT
jgi:beta-mannosidase